MRGRMNARERWGLLLIDEFPDQPPVFPMVTAHAAKAAGMNLIRYCSDGKAMAEAQLAAQKKYGQDGLSVFTNVGIIAEAMGSEYYLRDYEVPILKKPVVEDGFDIDSLQIPDPKKDGRLPVYLEACSRLHDAAGDILPVFAYITASFTTAAELRGVEEFLVDTIIDPEKAHRLLQLSLEAAIRLCDECIIAGALPIIVDPLASGSVISRQTYSDFALPYEKALIKHLHRYDLDITLHICGDTTSYLDLIPSSGADLFSFDKAPVAACRDCMGTSVRLIGNLPPNGLLGSSRLQVPEEIRRIETEGIINPKGFVLSTGCEVPIMCHTGKLEAMISEGRKFSY